MKENNTYPLISIALCTYNGEEYLKQQMDSLLSQSYPNLEIIISDDASTDQTVSILQSYSQANLFIFVNKKNLGFNQNFESCLKKCTGQYICISDQDDEWHTEKIQQLYEKIKNHPMVFSDSAFIDEKGKLLQTTMSQSLNRTFSPINSPLELVYCNIVSGHSMLFARKLLDKALPIPDSVFYDWWLAFVATTTGEVQYLDAELVNHREHSGSAMLIHSQKNILDSKKHRRSKRHKELLARIQLFSEVSTISKKDKLVLKKLHNLLQERLEKRFSWRLFLFFTKYGKELFIKYRDRPLLNRLNFYIKEAKKINC
ncbi:MAG: Alpha-L-Rha alpha-1,3-L-rhamnosyltransferase (EC [uncultured Thiotrichaceae bacterium]|uniref:Alpha-L-Rha alpha-1,3-L-rhamnosyltransferase (EC) n=1 Tax=uncultured Thiotrichaceae bacterium TaxID=298394 RepID=A0A6S6T2Q1_9GAMM|nr:MAG: Alpha-L-Rha alpha-1,3-L-rhamnosyltransferase (EC [uncultured Thiotrichaceae bacterium]